MATKQSPIQNINKNLQQFGQEEKIARAKLKAMPQSFNPEQGQALINATDAKVNQLENELVGVRGENIKQQIIALAKMQERGPLTADQQQELLSLLQEQKKLEIINLDQQYKQGLLDEAGQQQLIDLLRKQKQLTSPESGQELNTYGMPSSNAQKKIQDAKYKQLLSKIGPIADSPIQIYKKGVVTPRIRLAQNIYGAENIQVVNGKPEFIVSEEMRQQSGLRLPDTMPLPAGLGAETLQRLGTSLGAGVLASGAAIPLAGLATALGGPLAGAATMGGIEAAGGAGSEFFNVSRAVNELEKTGILSPEEISELKAKEIPTQTTYGGLAGLGGAALAGLPGAIKGVGKYLERAGTRGETETIAKRAIQEAYLTEKLTQASKKNPYEAAIMIQKAVKKSLQNARLKATQFFTQVRNAPKTAENAADVSNWFLEFANGLKDQPPEIAQSILSQVENSLGATAQRNVDLITGQETVAMKINPEQYLNTYEKLKDLADGFMGVNKDLYNYMINAKVAFQKPLIKANAANQILEEAAEEGVEAATQPTATKMGYTLFKSSPIIPETNTASYSAIKQGFQVLEDSYSKIPATLRKKTTGTPEEVNNNLFGAIFSGTGKQKITLENAQQINDVIASVYKKAPDKAFKKISDSIINQSVYRNPAEAVAEGYIGSKVTPELFEKASAITPQQQKALQAKGVSLDFGKQAKAAQAGAEEIAYRLNPQKILNISERNKETLGTMLGEATFEQSQQPIKNLYKQQQASMEPITAMDKLKQFFNDTTLNRIGIAGRPGFGTDTGVGAGVGTLVGGAAGIVAGNPLAGGGLGGVAGGLIGGNVRPLARAASAGISQMPLEAAESFVTNPLVRQGLVGAGKYATTNPNDISEAGSGIMQQGDDILQQILKLRKFTNGNY